MAQPSARPGSIATSKYAVDSGLHETTPIPSQRRRPLMSALSRVAPDAPDKVARVVVRSLYGMTNLSLRHRTQTCLNYGWATLDGDGVDRTSALSPEEAAGNDRMCLQLYERVAANHVADQTVLEIGCGRGGGTAFLKRGLSARHVTGVDITPSSIRWCQKYWSEPGVRFQVGDAESLNFADRTFDVIVNIESSHNYPHLDRFLRESHRVLKSGGLLLLADFRPTDRIPVLAQHVSEAGFHLDETEDISANVLRALSIMAPEWRAWVEGHVPRPLRRGAREFAADENSAIYRGLASGDRAYYRFVARKA